MRDLISAGILHEAYYKFQNHQHSVWEIIYYFDGAGSVSVGSNEISFVRGDIVCLPPDIPHCEFSETGYRNVHFTVQSFHNVWGSVPKFADNGSGDFYKILMQMYIEHHKKQRNWRGITEQLLCVLYQYMIAWGTISRKNLLVEMAENILLSNISNVYFNTNSLLKDIPLSEDHFRKLFKAENGITPLQYLTKKRIDYAKRLLEVKSMNHKKIIEVANLSGFDDPYYFSRVFKKTTGKSPSEWYSTSKPPCSRSEQG